MHLLTVIPIGRGIFKDSLHYFTSKSALVGSIVSVPVRKKLVPALVIDAEHVSNTKINIKSYPYKIKKIENLETESFFTPEFISLAHELAQYYAGDVGQVLSTLTPKELLTSSSSIKEPLIQPDNTNEHQTLWEGPLVLQGDDKERLAFYKSKIREEFAKDSSVFLCLPTTHDVKKISDSFEKGIKEYTIVLHGGLAKKKLLETWERATQTQHPVLIIATGHYLALPRYNIGTIIVERENSPAYKTLTRPFIDLKHAAYLFAKAKRIHFIKGDVTLRTETIYEKESGRAHPDSSVNYRLLSGGNVEIDDTSKYKDKKTFRCVGDTLLKYIEDTADKKERLFVFANRMGLSSFSVCGDCGKTIVCNNCDAPLVLHSSKSGQNIYKCHKCGTQHSDTDTCRHCGSWKITPLGIGIERVEKEIKKALPKVKLLRIDSTQAKTPKHAEKIKTEFFSSPGSVLLGTEMALPYIDTTVERVAVASMDSFFSIPDYRIKERALNILARLKLLGEKHFLIQTRNPDWQIFSHIKSGNLLNFYRDETAERKQFKFPPFSVLIKITREGEKKIISDDMKKLEKKLSGYSPIVYDAYIAKINNKTRVHLLLKIRKGTWPDEDLLKILKSLPPKFIINIDPLEIL